MSKEEKTTDSIVCQVCEKEYTSYGLPSHIKHSHDLSVDEYVEKHGEFRESKINENKKKQRDVQYIKCGECEKMYSSAGLHTHLAHTHDMTVEEYVEKHGEYRKKQKNRKKRKKNSDYECEICEETLVSDRQLSFHVRKEHDLSKKSYLLKHVFDGEHPKCECGCGQKVKILSHEPYKRQYISGHNSKGEDNPMYGKSHTDETKEKMKTKKFHSLTERLEDAGIAPLFDFEEYKGVEFEPPFEKYNFKCNNCEESFSSDLRRSRVPSCPNCTAKGYSSQHIELRDFFKSLNLDFVENCRTLFSGNLEVDFYFPEKDFAVEYHGLYWHCEISSNKQKGYHLSKTKKCENKEVQLVQIFGDEWRNKKDIVKSRLKYYLGVHQGERIYGRECKIKEVDPSLKNEFLDKHHIQGQDRSTFKLGLFYKNRIVSIMTFSRPRAFQSGEYEDDTWEISRFASQKDLIVLGAFGKLFKEFKKRKNPKQVYTYADRRYTSKISNVYSNQGFELESLGTPNYWYTDYDIRKHRFNFTKNKIVEELDGDPNLTEWENMKEKGYDRIWDCGHLKYIWKNTDN